MSAFKVIEYSDSLMDQWDRFVVASKNSHFMHSRTFMSYHSDRFKDSSLVIIDDRDRIRGLLPAAMVGNTLISHPGLSFGGLIVNYDMKADEYWLILDAIERYCTTMGEIEGIEIRNTPSIYFSCKSEESDYFLQDNGFILKKQKLSTVIDFSHKYKFQKRRLRSIKKGKSNNFNIDDSNDFEKFWITLTNVLLSQHNSSPVHSLKEILFLHKKFPKNIRCYSIIENEICLAGVVTFETDEVVHMQYIAANELARELGALDYLFENLINKYSIKKKYFCFGTSMNPADNSINNGLLQQKEGFGGRTVRHLTYTKSTSSMIY